MSTVHKAMAFDYGTKKIGIAVGQSITRTASPLSVLPATDGVPDWDILEKLVREWRPSVLIVGMPFNMDGSENEMTVQAQKFSRRLQGRFNIPCYTMDERLSSHAAKDIRKQQAAESGKKYNDREIIDSLAAQLILENWFATNID
ncbi:MAG: Holliday junction resolvase RuvX [Gammaproteobacteria bacterium]|nr:Holliday junction resolvase RuvX [Gammaproteobacteria bacterium]|tara:strand:- start:1326 stop:1760 length:435 start_codon:yes stop_codon:yes gene_type:complete